MPTITIYVKKLENMEPLEGAKVSLDATVKTADAEGKAVFTGVPYDSPMMILTHELYETIQQAIPVTQPAISLTFFMQLKTKPPDKVAFSSELQKVGATIIDSLQGFGRTVQDGLWGRTEGALIGTKDTILDKLKSIGDAAGTLTGATINAILVAVKNGLTAFLESEIEKDKREHPEKWE